MRILIVLPAIILPACLVSCATDSETYRAQQDYRAEQEAGGSLPWNRPASWEGAGAIGSQMNQFNQ